MKALWRLFASVRLTIVLAALICVTTAWGSMVTLRYPGFFRALDSEILMGWLASTGPSYLRITLWIYALVALIFLFAVNTAVCTADKLYSILKTGLPWRSLLPHVVHVGFLVALLGHLTGSVAGYKTDGNVLLAGEAAPVPNEPGLSVRLEAFDSERGPDGRLESLKTTVTLLKEGSEILTGEITINGPLRYKGTAFYHMDDGTTPTGLRLVVDGERVEAALGGALRTRDGSVFSLGRLYPDFALYANGRAYSRSDEFRNPHVEIIASDGETAYIDVSAPGASVTLDNRTWTLAGYIMTPYVVLSINRDPGIGLIIAGSAVLVAGMVALLFGRGERAELIRRTRTG